MCYPTLPRDGGVEELCGDPNSRTTPQGLNQRSKMEEVVPKMAHRRGLRCGTIQKEVVAKL